MRIDAHHHFWKLDEFDYIWMRPELKILNKDYLPYDLQPILEQQAIDRTVLVQTISSTEETRWFLRLAHEYSFIAGIVGWVDLTATDVAMNVEMLRSSSNRIVGIRHQVHDEPDDQWLLRKDVRCGLKALADQDLCYDLLIRPEHLSVSLEIARELTGLRLVVDHIAKPRIATRDGWDQWKKGVSALGACPNVWCKLSGMITEAEWSAWKPSNLRRYVEHVIESFGPGRVMFGSDWPVCLLAGDYAAVSDALEHNLSSLTVSERARIFGGSAADFYQLDLSQ